MVHFSPRVAEHCWSVLYVIFYPQRALIPLSPSDSRRKKYLRFTYVDQPQCTQALCPQLSPGEQGITWGGRDLEVDKTHANPWLPVPTFHRNRQQTVKVSKICTMSESGKCYEEKHSREELGACLIQVARESSMLLVTLSYRVERSDLPGGCIHPFVFTCKLELASIQESCKCWVSLPLLTNSFPVCDTPSWKKGNEGVLLCQVIYFLVTVWNFYFSWPQAHGNHRRCASSNLHNIPHTLGMLTCGA